MCGIFGFLSTRPSHAAPDARAHAVQDVLAAASGALAHRGPDGQGAHVVAGDGYTLGLAQTRLAILDLSEAGRQPMLSPRGDVLVVNGEIYNHRALRPALEAAGVVFRGTSDSETLLHLLAHEGVAGLAKTVGMFAFAYWDAGAETLVLGRDRFGKKPLYWTRGPLGVAFASEVRALLASGAAARTLDREALLRWLERGSCQDPTTLVRGVVSLPPGHVLRVARDGTFALAPWFALDLSPAPQDWRDQLEALLDDAVHARLLSDRPIGVFLSGGVDSAAIAAVAARHAQGALRSFTLGFDAAAADEAARAEATARRLGLAHHTAHLTAGEALAHLDDALAAQDLPSHDGFNTWFVTRAARAAGLVVALAGTGGDEVFTGYDHFRRLARRLRLGAAAAAILPRALVQRLRAGVHPSLPPRVRKALGLLATGGRQSDLYALVRELFSPLAASALAGATPLPSSPSPSSAAVAAAAAHTPDEEPETTLSRLELAGYLVDTQLRDIDAMSMAHGFEVRSPLLDHRLVAAVLAVPAAFKAPRRGVNKRLLVDLAGLPHADFAVAKRGFVLPWEAWLRGPLVPWRDRHLDPAALGATGVLDPAAVAAVVRAFEARRVSASRVVALVALAAWCTRHRLTA